MNKIKIILAADHAGFELKEKVKKYLQDKNYSITDVGANNFDQQDDYPRFMIPAAMKVAEDLDGQTMAILFGGSGQGEAMVANRFPGVRAVVWYGGNEEIIKLSRQHNNANALAIGARVVASDEAFKAIDLWLNTPFSDEERHQRRIEQIDNIQ